MKSKRTNLLIALLLACLLCLTGWSYWVMDQGQSQAAQAQHDAQACQVLSQQILSLRQKPAIADTKEQAVEQLSKRIETAARAAGIQGDNLAAIAPDPAVRLGDSVYLEKPTTVQLRQVTLAQLLNLAGQLSQGEGNLRIKSLRLSTSVQNDTGNLWSAEMTITYLIYSPLPHQPDKSQS